MTDRGLVRGLAAALLVTVASQLFYVTIVSGSPNEALRPLTWFTELFAFSCSTIAALALAARQPAGALLWATLALAGLLNILQVAVGLSMFAPALEAASTLPQLFEAVLAGAFFLYFLAKMLIGGAGISLGYATFREAKGFLRWLGAAGVLAGVSAMGFGFLAMNDAESWRFAAGASGTAATALFAILLLVAPPLPAE